MSMFDWRRRHRLPLTPPPHAADPATPPEAPGEPETCPYCRHVYSSAQASGEEIDAHLAVCPGPDPEELRRAMAATAREAAAADEEPEQPLRERLWAPDGSLSLAAQEPEAGPIGGPSGLSAPDRTPAPARHDVPPPPIPTPPHCNGRHGPGACDWCDALAQTITVLRHQEARQRELDERLTRIEIYLGIRRDGSGK